MSAPSPSNTLAQVAQVLGAAVALVPVAVAIGRTTGIASAVPFGCALALGVLCVLVRLREPRPAIPASLVGVAAAVWLAPLLYRLPDSPASGGMVPFVVGTAIGTAYLAARIAEHDRWYNCVEPPRAYLALLVTVGAITAGAAAASSAAHLTSRPMDDDWPVNLDLRTTCVGLSVVFALLVHAVAQTARAQYRRIATARRALVVVPGTARFDDGQTIAVPADLTGEILVLATARDLPGYRASGRESAAAILTGPRDARLRSHARRVLALDVFAVAGVLAVAAPASADLPRRLLLYPPW